MNKKNEKLWRAPIQNSSQAEEVIKNAANGFVAFYFLGILGMYGIFGIVISGILILCALKLRSRHSITAAWVLLVFSVATFLLALIWFCYSIINFNYIMLIGSIFCIGLYGLFLIATYRAHTAVIKFRRNDFSEDTLGLARSDCAGGKA